jgi:ribose transport system substrate-binding protein
VVPQLPPRHPAPPERAAGVTFAKAEIGKCTGPATPDTKATPLAKAPDLKGKTVWFVPIGGSVPIMQVTGSGMTAALTRLGAKVHTCDGNFLPTTIAQCLNAATTGGAAAVVTGYIDYAEVPTAFDNVINHNIPVLTTGVRPSGGRTSDPKLTFFPADVNNFKAATLMSDVVIADSKGTAKALALRITDSVATREAADAGVQSSSSGARTAQSTS